MTADVRYIHCNNNAALAVSTRESLPRGNFSNLHRLIYPVSVEPVSDVGLNGRRVKFASLPRLS